MQQFTEARLDNGHVMVQINIPFFWGIIRKELLVQYISDSMKLVFELFFHLVILWLSTVRVKYQVNPLTLSSDLFFLDISLEKLIFFLD